MSSTFKCDDLRFFSLIMWQLGPMFFIKKNPLYSLQLPFLSCQVAKFCKTKKENCIYDSVDFFKLLVMYLLHLLVVDISKECKKNTRSWD